MRVVAAEEPLRFEPVWVETGGERYALEAGPGGLELLEAAATEPRGERDA